MEKISIIIPIYNSEFNLKKCLDSVINQTYKNIEIILIDDASTDNSYQICLEYKNKDSRIILLHNNINQGVSISRNIALKHVSGKYITFIDSDDYVSLDYVETMYNLIKIDNYDIAVIVYVKIINNKEKFIFKEKQNILNQEEAFEKLFEDNNFTPAVVCKLFKKELFNHIKFPDYKIFEDIEVIGNILLKVNKIIYSSISKYYYVIRPNSLSFSSYTIKDHDRIIHSKDLIDKVVNKYPNLEKQANLFYLNNILAVSNKQLFLNIYKSDIIRLTKKIIKDNFFDIIFSNIELIKKIQFILFLINIRLYKLIYNIVKDEISKE